MDDAVRRRADEILDRALDQPPEERAAFVADAAGGDEQLRALVLRLVAAAATGHADGLRSGGGLLGELGDELADELSGGAPLEPGVEVGRYRVVRELGRGGMAVVYLAERVGGEFDQRVAIKVLQRGGDGDEAVARFARERQILALASHPSIARLLDGGLGGDGRPFLVMEYVDGVPIDTYCDDHALPLRDRLRVFLRVAEAVEHAHRNLVVHRDIKPSNVLVTEEGHVKLLDFGIAKLLEEDGQQLTRGAGAPMTPAFAAPEQVTGGPVTTATDVYQLGVLLYVLLTGCWPYRSGGSDAALAVAICRETPTRPSAAVAERDGPTAVPGGAVRDRERIAAARASTPERLRRDLCGDLDTIVLTALRKEPERRYGSVAQLTADLRRYLDGRTISARPDTFAYRARLFLRRHAAASAVAAVAVLALAGLTGVYTARLGAERDRARLEAAKAGEVARFLTGLFEVAAPTRSKGEEVTARELLDRGATRIDAELADQPELQAHLMTVIGTVYGDLALYDEATVLLQRAIALRRERGDDPVGLAASLHELGRMHERTRATAEAAAELEEALALREVALGPRHPDTARTRSALGLAVMGEGEGERARALHEQAVADLEAALGPDDPDLGVALGYLANAVRDLRDYAGSVPIYERACAILDARLGPDHPYAAAALFNFATSLRFTGQGERADAVYREVLPRIRAAYGDDHPAVGIVLNNHALLLNGMGLLDDAEAVHRRALAVFERILGPEHLQVAWSHNNIGLVQRERGDHAAALASFRRSLEITEAAVGPDHAEMAAVLENAAEELIALGRAAEAVPLAERAVAIKRKVYGDEHSFVAESEYALATALLESGRADAALGHARRTLMLARPEPEHHRSDVTRPTLLLARCLVDLGRAGEARRLLEEELPRAGEAAAEVETALAGISVGGSH